MRLKSASRINLTLEHESEAREVRVRTWILFINTLYCARQFHSGFIKSVCCQTKLELFCVNWTRMKETEAGNFLKMRAYNTRLFT